MTIEELRQRYEDESAMYNERETTRAKREFEKVLRKLYKHPLKTVWTKHHRTASLAETFGLVVNRAYCEMRREWSIRIGPYLS